jgi:hypothetical protein
MGRKRNLIPSYLRHAPSGQAYCRVGGRVTYLGPHGSERSRENYARVLQAIVSGAVTVSPRELTVADLAREYAQATVDPVVEEVAGSLGGVVAARFGIDHIRTLRAEWVSRGLGHEAINQRVSRVRRCFRWAANEGLVPPGVWAALAAVMPLTAADVPAGWPSEAAAT